MVHIFFNKHYQCFWHLNCVCIKLLSRPYIKQIFPTLFNYSYYSTFHSSSMSGMTVKSDFPAFPFHLCPPHDLFYYYTPVLSFSSLALLCWLQAALRDSTGTAAASRVHSVSTALGHATMSQVNVSACLASLAPCVTKASSLLCHFDLLSCFFLLSESFTVKF